MNDEYAYALWDTYLDNPFELVPKDIFQKLKNDLFEDQGFELSPEHHIAICESVERCVNPDEYGIEDQQALKQFVEGLETIRGFDRITLVNQARKESNVYFNDLEALERAANSLLTVKKKGSSERFIKSPVKNRVLLCAEMIKFFRSVIEIDPPDTETGWFAVFMKTLVASPFLKEAGLNSNTGDMRETIRLARGYISPK